MSIDPDNTVVIGPAECPEISVELNSEQLKPLLEALRVSIGATIQAYRVYLNNKDDCSPRMRKLFDQYAPSKNEKSKRWKAIERFLSTKDEATFTDLLDSATKRLVIDEKMQLYCNAKDGYSLVLPSATSSDFTKLASDQDKMSAACLFIFKETRIAEAEYFMSSRVDDGEGTHFDFKQADGAGYSFEFDEAKNLCRFVNHCAPTGVRFSLRDLQMTRH